MAGRYRPNVTGTCGPACLLRPSECMEAAGSPFGAGTSNEGCNRDCTPAPAGVSYAQQGAVQLGDADGCLPFFVCKGGYHLNNARNGCEACDIGNVSVAQYCGPWHYLLPYENCSTTTTTSQMCVRCPVVEHGTLSREGRGCNVVCDPGYFYAADVKLCVPCTNVTDCPQGMYSDVATCVLNQTRPVCRPCSGPPTVEMERVLFLTSGGTSANGCRMRCVAGFHTLVPIAAASALGADAQGYTRPNVSLHIDNVTACTRCTEGESRSCVSTCSPGQYRNLQVADGMAGGCVKCLVSSACQAGQYAPQCWGNETRDSACTPCDAPPPLQQFVTYASQWVYGATLVKAGDCPTACINNHVLSADGGCTACPRVQVKSSLVYFL